ncbi:MAG: peptidylprolyl isomerase [Clostridiales bacterium]|nr:peptidylprolyl isomerase [Candidatus Equinaster intestinalis]
MVTSSPQTQSTASTDDSLITKPVIELKENAIYYADIDIKNYGVITVKLDQKAAPITVSNFINLSNSGFYNGLTFHRIMEGFMMQGGDPNGNGTGGSNQNIKGEFTANGVSNSLSHTRGAISMARATPYDSASSQFFIVHQDSSFSLDGQYAVFGYVKSGMDIVDKICTSAKPLDNNGKIAPSEQPIINSIKIRTVE